MANIQKKLLVYPAILSFALNGCAQSIFISKTIPPTSNLPQESDSPQTEYFLPVTEVTVKFTEIKPEKKEEESREETQTSTQKNKKKTPKVQNDAKQKKEPAVCTKYKLTYEVKAVPNRSERYGLFYDPAVFYNDHIVISTTDGLLNGEHAETTESTVPLIFSKLAETAASLAQAAVKMSAKLPTKCLNDPMDFEGKYQVFDRSSRVTLNRKIDDWASKHYEDGKKKLELKEGDGTGANGKWLNLQARTHFFETKNGEYTGLLWHPRIPTHIRMEDNNNQLIGDQFDFTAFDINQTYSQDIGRGVFTKQETKVTWASGEPIKHDLDRPSEVYGFISIPLDAAKAAVSVFSGLFTVRNIDEKHSTASLKAETDLITQQKEFLQVQQELAKLKKEGAN
jgi:hypothetical protein